MLTQNITKINLVENADINVININNISLQVIENTQGRIILSFSEKIEKIKNFSEKLLIEFDIIEEEMGN